MFLRLSDYMVCQFPLFLIEIHGSHPGSEISTRSSGTAFHPQMDGQPECVIQILENMFRCCILKFEGNWKRNDYPSSQVLKLHRTKFYMIMNVKLHSIGLSLVRKRIHRIDLVCEIEENPRFIGPYEIIEKNRTCYVQFGIILKDLIEFINVIYVYMLRRYRSDPSHVISLINIGIQFDIYATTFDMTHSEGLIEIMACEVKELRNKKVTLVKKIWQ
ncbi:receptor-like protein kinase [Gossypium australe]|uniref:Receptor-like protein kinase n=1 Tax=Gossypium australe TaxID=47621 RepID=A0A5B6X436_9ROSI|nr:receptor-like protein kinase [Gossypium australe]